MTSRTTSNTSISPVLWTADQAPSRADMAPSLKHDLAQAMAQCRVLTLKLFEDIDPETFCRQAHGDFSPIGWHLGHIGYTEAIWVLGHLARGSESLSLNQLSRSWPEYCQLFAADSLPKEERGNLPSLGEIQADLAMIRAQVLDYLVQRDPTDQERLWRFLLQHESQHCETIRLILAIQRQTAAGPGDWARSEQVCSEGADRGMVYFSAAQVPIGSNAPEALDNERPAHGVHLAAYWLDRVPVTQAQYRRFITAGGYRQSQWWSAAGWEWVQRAGVTAPFYGGGPEQAQHPVCGVSWYEAQAYARFVGKRLPTEAEWEQAARASHPGQANRHPGGEDWPQGPQCNYADGSASGTTPVDRYGTSLHHCWDLLGNVWEWTDSGFESYPDFQPYPYPGYSQAYYDGQHYVLRGGSWATQTWALRASFRNWYHPWTREIFAGFRCARDGA
jgi:gamma-glutamyl hercynylcysteine S-oxide synthase